MALGVIETKLESKVGMKIETSMETSFGHFSLNRYPVRKKESLRAWDAADEFVLFHLDENDLLDDDTSVLILNDGFGGMSIPLNQHRPVVMTDSYLSMQGIVDNLVRNDMDEASVTILNSLEPPEVVFEKAVDVVLIKLPKSLAMLEDQLYRIKPVLSESTMIIAAGMTRNVHMSTMALFEKIIGPTTTSRARKKARLIFSQLDKDISVSESPYPQTYEPGYKVEEEDLQLVNHAAVFSREKLDIGTRLFIEHMPVDERYQTIIDLGCGNGILGLIAALKNPQAELVFTDESYMAVESAIENFLAVFGQTREAEFMQTDCLQGIEDNSASLILCNPPFHQNNAMNDDVAWQMFTESKAALVDAGELWVIGNRHLGYHAKLKHLFGRCDVVASNKKFTLLKSSK